MTYDIQFTIFRDELEIGFGGCTGSTIDQALHDVESVIRRREWETTGLRVVVPPGEESDDLRDRLAEIRASHQWNFATLWCSCGEGAFITRDEFEAHYHLDAVLPLVREAQAEAWDEGVAAGRATDITAETQPANPYRETP